MNLYSYGAQYCKDYYGTNFILAKMYIGPSWVLTSMHWVLNNKAWVAFALM